MLLPITEILQKRHLEKPDSRPLYAYRCTDDEFTEVRNHVRENVTTCMSWAQGGPAHFCLFAAEWWKRNYSGGPWAWEPILSGADLNDINFQDLYWLVEKGLQFWNRELITSHDRRMFLVTLACEGGLPMKLVQREGTHLRNFFFHLLDDYSQFRGSGVPTQQLAANAARRIPASLRHDVVYELSALLVEKIWALHEIIGETKTPVVILDSQFPDWRDELPLNLEDDTARALFSSLLQEVASVINRGGRPIRIIRGLNLADGGPRLETHLEVPGRLSAEVMSDLLAMPRSEIPSSFQLWLENDCGDREFCALITEHGGGEEGYRVESPFATANPVFESDNPTMTWWVSAVQNGSVLATQPCRGGAALGPGPWVFQQNGDLWLPLIAQGNCSTSSETVAVAADQAHAGDLGALKHDFLGSLVDWNRAIFNISGEVRLGGADGHSWRIKTGSTGASSFEYRLIGESIDVGSQGQPVFVGLPEVRAYKNCERAASATVPPEKLLLKPVCSNTKRAPTDRPVYGDVWLEIFEGGCCVERQRVSVLPRGFSLSINPARDNRSGTVSLSGLEGALVATKSNDHFTSRASLLEDGAWEIKATTANGGAASHIPVMISWPEHDSHISLKIPLPVRHCHFEDRSGDIISCDSLVTVDRIHRINGVAVSPEPSELFTVEGSLITDDVAHDIDVSVSLGMKADRVGRRTADLRRLAAELDRLLSFTNNLDGWVRLIIESSRGNLRPTPLRVARYDTEFEIDKRAGMVKVRGSGSVANLEVQCVPLWAPATPPLPLAAVQEQGAWFLPRGVPRGPWLAIGRTGSWVRARPTLVPVVDSTPLNTEDLNRLQKAILEQDECHRRDAIVECLEFAVTGETVEEHSTFIATVELAKDVHPSALDTMVALACHPEIATRAIICNDGQTGEAIWRGLERLRFSWHVVGVSTFLSELFSCSKRIRSQLERVDPCLAASIIHDVANKLFEKAGWLRPVQEWFEVYMAPNRREAGPGLLITAARDTMGRNVLEAQLRDLASEMAHRRDGLRWPGGSSIVERLRAELEKHSGIQHPIGRLISDFVNSYERFRWPVIAAPIVASAISAHDSAEHNPLTNAELNQLLRSRAFDHEWFDQAYSRSLALWMERVRDVETEAYSFE